MRLRHERQHGGQMAAGAVAHGDDAVRVVTQRSGMRALRHPQQRRISVELPRWPPCTVLERAVVHAKHAVPAAASHRGAQAPRYARECARPIGRDSCVNAEPAGSILRPLGVLQTAAESHCIPTPPSIGSDRENPPVTRRDVAHRARLPQKKSLSSSLHSLYAPPIKNRMVGQTSAAAVGR
jgi:hypothetical protein